MKTGSYNRNRCCLIRIVVAALIGILATSAGAKEVPIGIFGLYAWGDWNDAFRLVSESKFDLVVGVSSLELLDQAQRRGVKCIVSIVLTKDIVNDEKKWQKYLSELRALVTKLKSHPAVFAWFPTDEPDWNEVPIEKIKAITTLIRAIDTAHPIFTVLTIPEKWSDYLPYFDIISVDPYLTQKSSGERDTPEKVGRYLTKVKYDLRRMNLKKPVWVILGTFSLKPRNRGQNTIFVVPTPFEFEKMVDISLAQDVDGILLYSLAINGGAAYYNWNLPKDDPVLWKSIKDIVSGIKKKAATR